MKLKFDEIKSMFEEESIKEKNNNPKIYIFTSIDLVNSTSFKAENSNWPKVFFKFYDLICAIFTKNNLNIDIFKYLGDEVVFCEEVKSLPQILRAPSETFNLIMNCQELLNEKIDELCSNVKNKLYLKGTLWIAPIYKFHPQNKDMLLDNIIVDLEIGNLDFIGVNIDEGFRLTQHSSQNKLVIDAKMAYLMYEYKDKVNEYCDYNVQDRIRIIGYRKLKGIWGERYYPILWYDKRWSRPNEMYLYDEFGMSDIVKDFYYRNYEAENIEKVQIILEEIGIKDRKIKEIEDILDSLKSESKSEYIPIKDCADNLEWHCIAICFRKKDNKVLIGKKKCEAPGVWEFGCVEYNTGVRINELLIMKYKQDFNINIKIFDYEKQNKNVLNTIFYESVEEKGIEKSLIFEAEIIDDTNITFDKNKYEEIRFIGENEIDSFNENVIPGFKQILKEAFKKYNTFNKK